MPRVDEEAAKRARLLAEADRRHDPRTAAAIRDLARRGLTTRELERLVRPGARPSI